MSFVQRALDFTVQLGQGSFGEGGFDTVKLSGLRASVTISKTALPSMNTASIRIYGLTQSLMNKLSRIGVLPSATRNNVVTVMAGSDGSMALAYAGGIYEAWPDFSALPEVAFNIIAYTGLLAMMKPALPTSYPGSVDVAVVIERLAQQMGYAFENNGVSVMLSNPYLPGTARAQVIAAAAAADIYAVFDDEKHILAILPKDGARAGVAPLISPSTGMVGYPAYAGPGQIALRTLYNPQIRFMGQVNVQSSQTPANGIWAVNRLVHTLESQVPGGAWFSDIQGNVFLANR